MAQLIGISEFVKRQTPESRFSHFDGTWEELRELVLEAYATGAKCKHGYRDGVVLVPVYPLRFKCGVVNVDSNTELRATFGARREGEQPFITVEAVGGEKLPAGYVEVVLYRKDVLEEGGDPATGAEWDVISVNARPTPEAEPQTPVAMARNFLQLPGGTKAEYTAEEFAKAIIYWADKAMRGV